MYYKEGTELPVHVGDLMLENPNWTLGDALPEGWHEVLPTEPPELTKYQSLQNDTPILKNGKYYQTFKIIEASEEQKATIDAPENAKAKLKELGLTELEIAAIMGRAF